MHNFTFQIDAFEKLKFSNLLFWNENWNIIICFTRL